MAISLVPFRPIGVRASATATANRRGPDAHGRKISPSNWWTPLFGWSSEPYYIESDNSTGSKADLESKSGSDPDPMTAARPRFAPGAFTDDKARRLRMMTTGTASFHDVMYHSAIASRLASDFSAGPESDP